MKILTREEEAFCVYYARYLDSETAYRVAYDAQELDVTLCLRAAAKLHRQLAIKNRIVELKSQIITATPEKIAPSDILKMWIEIATADPNELVQLRRGPCGQCAYQSPNPKEINPLCDHCYGDGVPHAYFADSRFLTGSARRLYAGVKKTKDGLQVLMRDQDAALLNLAKYFDMFGEKESKTIKLDIDIFKDPTTTPIDASKAYQKMMGK